MTTFKSKSMLMSIAVLCVGTHGFGVNKAPLPMQPNLAPSQSSAMLQEISMMKHDVHVSQAGLSQAAINTDAGITETPRRRRSSPIPEAAHGMLSPETVARMDENAMNGKTNPAVEGFLRTYRKKGPMSCLEMLSDPDVLPHLTQAMRDIV